MKLTDLQQVAATAASIWKNSVIGGGAVRDAFLGGPIKDIDLFVDTRDLSNPLGFSWDEQVDILAKTLGGAVSLHAFGTASIPGEQQNNTYHVHWSGPVVEVLPVSRDVIADADDYDFGISQVQMTKDGIRRLPGFDKDLRDNTITYLGDETWAEAGRARSALRLKRILAKYPDRTPVNCEVLL
ncbi:hypothetical protein QTI51_09525 [Variovorax sp. J22G73]|uniref:hypothetical protein n=1 Tax=unclassified Variovorax TaxID=663243 RepID=UPI00257549D7|nr:MULTISPECIES: hypothetical protein [unclassified Variovorax]MDM0006461.1 hypothetical protein [Variovorax sp. J22R203]MDM0097516.1 hypothetical protein [Variovorax sp. J22G73]